jgi:hypothetical protein
MPLQPMVQDKPWLAVSLSWPAHVEGVMRLKGATHVAVQESRRGSMIAGAAMVWALCRVPPSQALPRGGIDARVATAFNTALAAGGDPVVCCAPLRCLLPHTFTQMRHATKEQA